MAKATITTEKMKRIVRAFDGSPELKEADEIIGVLKKGNGAAPLLFWEGYLQGMGAANTTLLPNLPNIVIEAAIRRTGVIPISLRDFKYYTAVELALYRILIQAREQVEKLEEGRG